MGNNDKFDFSVMSEMTSSAGMREPAPYRQDREEVFRVKVSMQQFMNHNGPIFKAFAYKGIHVREVADGDALLGPTEAASTLTKLVAAAVLKDKGNEITARDLSFFRAEAANWVAERWMREEDYAVETAARDIAKAVLTAGADWNHEPFKDDRISNDASLMMSAAGITTKLMAQVGVYDFRIGRNEVLKTLLDSVVRTSLEAVQGMLPKSASKGDVVNLVQTVSRNFAGIMEAIYERKVREVVEFLKDKETAEITRWLNKNRPLDTIVDEFKDWALCFVGFAVATSSMISMQPEQPAPARRAIDR